MIQTKVKVSRGNDAAIQSCESPKILSSNNLSFIYARKKTGWKNAEVVLFPIRGDFIEGNRQEVRKDIPHSTPKPLGQPWLLLWLCLP